jgi:hypothetical protein
VPDERLTLALDEARRAIDHQESALASIRGRAATLLAVGGLAASFIGGLAMRNGVGISAWTLLGVIAFVGLVVFASLIAWPWEFRFDQSATVLVAWAEQHEADPDKMTRDLALFHERNLYRNRPTLDRLMTWYTVGVGFLIAEIIALVLDLRGR